MKYLFIFLLGILPVLSYAQETKINFQHTLSWDEMLKKAEIEKKLIFVDCYTTWCIPCKVMEKEIFSQPIVGDFFNANFINAAIQFDKTKRDNDGVKKGYATVRMLNSKYKISAYPTFLFFNAKGVLIHFFDGASLNSEDFINKAKNALNPDKQLSNLKFLYSNGANSPEFLRLLISLSKETADDQFTDSVINKYLLYQKNLLDVENLKFISLATQKSTDPGYTVLLNNSKEFNAVCGEGQSERLLKNIAFDEIVLPVLRKNGNKVIHGPMVSYSGELQKNIDWDFVKKKLDNQFPNLSDEIILTSKITYFRWQDNWPQFSESVSLFVSKYGNENNSDEINSWARDIFLFSDDQKCVSKALDWSKKNLSGTNKTNIDYLLTYANLLYKSNHKYDAKVIVENLIKDVGDKSGQLHELLDKINKNEKTW